MTKKLEGKIAVITGGTEGIGLATAKLFVKEGMEILLASRGCVRSLGFQRTSARETGDDLMSQKTVLKVSFCQTRGLRINAG